MIIRTPICGQATRFLAQTFHAVANGPNWQSTVFIVTYDEWGGFLDDVAPPRAVAPNTVRARPG